MGKRQARAIRWKPQTTVQAGIQYSVHHLLSPSIFLYVWHSVIVGQQLQSYSRVCRWECGRLRQKPCLTWSTQSLPDYFVACIFIEDTSAYARTIYQILLADPEESKETLYELHLYSSFRKIILRDKKVVSSCTLETEPRQNDFSIETSEAEKLISSGWMRI
jgi:hypothetical protein